MLPIVIIAPIFQLLILGYAVSLDVSDIPVVVDLDPSERQAIRLDLYDIIGRKVKTIAEGTVEPGVYIYRLDSSNLSACVYFLILEGERASRTKELLIVR